MGTEISLQEGRSVAEREDVTRKEYLRFHEIHGDNVKLEQNRTIASRPEGFCKGIAFSHRPIKVREPVYIKFVDISSNWSGALRIGFTTHDPATMKSKLPLYACPNLTSMEGNWVKAISERMAKKDSILYYYVEQNGDVHYGIDSVSYGFFFGGVCTTGKLWAVLDIYGNTISVEFLNPNPLMPDRSISSPNNSVAFRSHKDIENSATNVIPDQNENLYWEPQVRGKNVRIEGYHHAYRKTGSKDQAYIFLNQSLKLGWRIALEVIQTTSESKGSLVYGVTSCNPSTLKPFELPKDPNDLVDRPEYWIVKYDSNSYQERDIIIYSIDMKGEVSVRKNKDKFATFHVDPTQPIWLFFNIVGLVSGLGIIGAVCSDDLVKQMENLKVSLPDKDQESKGPLPGPSNQANSECVICYEELVDCALYRCGHMCMCYKCALKMWQPGSKAICPMCRNEILDVIKIYK